MEQLPKGTKEILYVDVKDRLNTIDTLDGLTLTWSVIGDEGEEISSGSADNNGMMILAGPIDTSSMDEDEYDLFVSIDNPPELIKLGPFRFVVN